jgi:hypothetical protein
VEGEHLEEVVAQEPMLLRVVVVAGVPLVKLPRDGSVFLTLAARRLLLLVQHKIQLELELQERLLAMLAPMAMPRLLERC